jgi:hypothetical protein
MLRRKEAYPPIEHHRCPRQLPLPVANCPIAHVNEVAGKPQGIGGHSRSEERGKKMDCKTRGRFEAEGRRKPAHQRCCASLIEQEAARRCVRQPVWFGAP